MVQKKHASTRARRNVAAGAATLPAEGRSGPTPELPPLVNRHGEDAWHPLVLLWWADLWSSPMSAEYHESDLHQLYVLAQLYNDFHTAGSATARKEAATEIR